MKKLIMLSAFALVSAFSFASNGEKEIIKFNLSNENVEKCITVEDQEFFTVKSVYTIVIWHSFWDPVTFIGSSYGKEVITTSCYTEAEAETFRAGLETLYKSMNTTPNTDVWAVKHLDHDCI